MGRVTVLIVNVVDVVAVRDRLVVTALFVIVAVVAMLGMGRLALVPMSVMPVVHVPLVKVVAMAVVIHGGVPAVGAMFVGVIVMRSMIGARHGMPPACGVTGSIAMSARCFSGEPDDARRLTAYAEIGLISCRQRLRESTEWPILWRCRPRHRPAPGYTLGPPLTTGGPIGSETAAWDVDDPWPGRRPPTSEPGGLQGLPDRVVAACVALDMCTDRDDHLVLLGEVLLQSLTLVEHGVRALCA
jgi:hypothetical protein